MDAVRPEDYDSWRRAPLGAITEAAEQRLVFRLAGPLAGLRLLDVGCGDGAYAIAAAQLGARVHGIDTSPQMIEAARRRAVEQGAQIDLRVADAAALPFEDGSFDVVLAVTVLCFVPDTEAALGEIARVLAPGGRLVLGELGRWNLWAAWRRIRGWIGSRTWRHARFRSARQLCALLRKAGFAVEEVRGAIYYPPIPLAARVLAPVNGWCGALTTLGAAFIGLAAVKRSAAAG